SLSKREKPDAWEPDARPNEPKVVSSRRREAVSCPNYDRISIICQAYSDISRSRRIALKVVMAGRDSAIHAFGYSQKDVDASRGSFETTGGRGNCVPREPGSSPGMT